MKHLSQLISNIALLLIVFVISTNAHTHIRDITINGHQYDRKECLRPWGYYMNYPVVNMTGFELRCGYGGRNPIDTVCPAPAGSELKFHWRSENGEPDEDVVYYNHVGPCLVYMAPLESNGVGDVWFKVYEEGYNTETKQWCTSRLIENGGYLNFTLPKDIPSGEYLVRGELIALHFAKEVWDLEKQQGPQLYINCAQIKLTGGDDNDGTGLPEKTVSFPGAYKATDPGLLIDVDKADLSKYVIPGPPVYNAVDGGSESK
ncbi:hypothetical protein H4219_006249 [Mycoemilia scoparia]|uniref:AA9 family lytic polysaccharide monooxygenase n=1 Tax=Mycoemilia scoparia TaxID=417184 RepID=A0A9W7ZKY4_9FUNG|nr:hypothetical protein H4219_006249 [Mycoemilia scoparia]